MPFPLVFRVPRSVEDETLRELRFELVRITSELMGCPKEWVGPDFFRCALEDSQDPNEGCNTVLVKLETGLFLQDKPDDYLQVEKVLKALTNAVLKAFGGKYEVEASVVGWHPGWKYLRKAFQFDCQVLGCDGLLGEETFPMQTGCHSCSPCRACIVCGRVHSFGGDLMFGRAGHSPFLREDEIEWVLEPVKFLPGERYKTTSWLWVTIDGDDDELVAGVKLIFDCMDGETFCFQGEDGVKYRLHRGDVNFVEPV